MFGKGNFSGQFRRLPTVSIGGASKSESKDELIRRAQQERRQREVIIALTHVLVGLQPGCCFRRTEVKTVQCSTSSPRCEASWLGGG